MSYPFAGRGPGGAPPPCDELIAKGASAVSRGRSFTLMNGGPTLNEDGTITLTNGTTKSLSDEFVIDDGPYCLSKASDEPDLAVHYKATLEGSRFKWDPELGWQELEYRPTLPTVTDEAKPEVAPQDAQPACRVTYYWLGDPRWTDPKSPVPEFSRTVQWGEFTFDHDGGIRYRTAYFPPYSAIDYRDPSGMLWIRRKAGAGRLTRIGSGDRVTRTFYYYRTYLFECTGYETGWYDQLTTYHTPQEVPAQPGPFDAVMKFVTVRRNRWVAFGLALAASSIAANAESGFAGFIAFGLLLFCAISYLASPIPPDHPFWPKSDDQE